MKKYPYLRPFVETDGFSLSKFPKKIEQCINLGYYQEPEDSILILPSRGQNLNESSPPEDSPPYGIVTQGSSNMTIQLPSHVGIFYELGDKDKVWDSKIDILLV